MDWRWTLTHIVLGILFLLALFQVIMTYSGLYRNTTISPFKDTVPSETMNIETLWLTLAANISSYENIVYWSIVFIEAYIITYFVYFLLGNLCLTTFLLIFFFVLVLLLALTSLQQYYVNRKLYQYGLKNIAFLQGKIYRSKFASKEYISSQQQ